jgi:predicted restriction endonuclease
VQRRKIKLQNPNHFYIESNEYITCGVMMPLEKDLQQLTLPKLKLLAEKKGVSLERPNWVDFGKKTRTLKTKPEIIDALLKSSKITKKAIEEISKKEPTKDRDANRAFNRTQKNEILFQQDNKCAVCHEKLDPRATEFDHEKPWASGGRTITENGRATCANCHKIITHKHRLEKVDR